MEIFSVCSNITEWKIPGDGNTRCTKFLTCFSSWHRQQLNWLHWMWNDLGIIHSLKPIVESNLWGFWHFFNTKSFVEGKLKVVNTQTVLLLIIHDFNCDNKWLCVIVIWIIWVFKMTPGINTIKLKFKLELIC